MKKSFVVGAIALLGASSVFADSYLKAEAQISYNDFASDVCDVAASCTDKPNGYRFAYGYELNDNFAFEFGYGSSGKFKAADGSDQLSVEVKSIDVAAIGRLPLSDLFAFTGKLGFTRTDADTKFSNTFFSENDNQSSTVPVYGVGMEISWFTLGYEVINDAEIGLFDGDSEEDNFERIYAGVKINF